MKIYRSEAKVNLFLKITGLRGSYHELMSRFIKVSNLYDDMVFVEERGAFNIHGFGKEVSLNNNIIYKTLQNLIKTLNVKNAKRVDNFFNEHSLSVTKRVPMMAGLGGGSSNSATFLKMVDEVLKLNLSDREKLAIVEPLGSDIAFFLNPLGSANVSGVGEIVEPFEEETPKIDVYTPDISCNTGAVYREYRNNFLKLSDINSVKEWLNKPSKELFSELKIESANDLYPPALSICPKLAEAKKDGYLFSGSGSSFFRVKS